jgi:uncharacterized protein YaaR (DUF327 family)
MINVKEVEEVKKIIRETVQVPSEVKCNCDCKCKCITETQIKSLIKSLDDKLNTLYTEIQKITK